MGKGKYVAVIDLDVMLRHIPFTVRLTAMRYDAMRCDRSCDI